MIYIKLTSPSLPLSLPLSLFPLPPIGSFLAFMLAPPLILRKILKVFSLFLFSLLFFFLFLLFPFPPFSLFFFLSFSLSFPYPSLSSSPGQNGEKDPNLPFFIWKLGIFPERINNIYFTYLFLIRALNAAQENLISFDYGTGVGKGEEEAVRGFVIYRYIFINIY